MHEGMSVAGRRAGYWRWALAGALALWVFACQTVGEPAMRDLTFQSSRDGTAQRVVVVAPVRRAGCDALIALHGHGSDRWQFVRDARPECAAARDFAQSRGMVYASPDYRASTSWMGPAAEDDLVDIVELLKRRHGVKRVFVCGGSMGGASALAFAVRHPEVVAGVTSMNGTANMLSYEGFQEAIAASYGGTKGEVPEVYRERSAEYFPERLTMPVAMTAGGQDTVVPADSLVRLRDALAARGTPVLLLLREEGGHATNYEDAMQALAFMYEQADRAELQGGTAHGG